MGKKLSRKRLKKKKLVKKAKKDKKDKKKEEKKEEKKDEEKKDEEKKESALIKELFGKGGDQGIAHLMKKMMLGSNGMFGSSVMSSGYGNITKDYNDMIIKNEDAKEEKRKFEELNKMKKEKAQIAEEVDRLKRTLPMKKNETPQQFGARIYNEVKRKRRQQKILQKREEQGDENADLTEEIADLKAQNEANVLLLGIEFDKCECPPEQVKDWFEEYKDWVFMIEKAGVDKRDINTYMDILEECAQAQAGLRAGGKKPEDYIKEGAEKWKKRYLKQPKQADVLKQNRLLTEGKEDKDTLLNQQLENRRTQRQIGHQREQYRANSQVPVSMKPSRNLRKEMRTKTALNEEKTEDEEIINQQDENTTTAHNIRTNRAKIIANQSTRKELRPNRDMVDAHRESSMLGRKKRRSEKMNELTTKIGDKQEEIVGIEEQTIGEEQAIQQMAHDPNFIEKHKNIKVLEQTKKSAEAHQKTLSELNDAQIEEAVAERMNEYNPTQLFEATLQKGFDIIKSTYGTWQQKTNKMLGQDVQNMLTYAKYYYDFKTNIDEHQANQLLMKTDENELVNIAKQYDEANKNLGLLRQEIYNRAGGRLDIGFAEPLTRAIIRRINGTPHKVKNWEEKKAWVNNQIKEYKANMAYKMEPLDTHIPEHEPYYPKYSRNDVFYQLLDSDQGYEFRMTKYGYGPVKMSEFTTAGSPNYLTEYEMDQDGNIYVPKLEVYREGKKNELTVHGPKCTQLIQDKNGNVYSDGKTIIGNIWDPRYQDKYFNKHGDTYHVPTIDQPYYHDDEGNEIDMDNYDDDEDDYVDPSEDDAVLVDQIYQHINSEYYETPQMDPIIRKYHNQIKDYNALKAAYDGKQQMIERRRKQNDNLRELFRSVPQIYEAPDVGQALQVFEGDIVNTMCRWITTFPATAQKHGIKVGPATHAKMNEFNKYINLCNERIDIINNDMAAKELENNKDKNKPVRVYTRVRKMPQYNTVQIPIDNTDVEYEAKPITKQQADRQHNAIQGRVKPVSNKPDYEEEEEWWEEEEEEDIPENEAERRDGYGEGYVDEEEEWADDVDLQVGEERDYRDPEKDDEREEWDDWGDTPDGQGVPENYS